MIFLSQNASDYIALEGIWFHAAQNVSANIDIILVNFCRILAHCKTCRLAYHWPMISLPTKAQQLFNRLLLSPASCQIDTKLESLYLLFPNHFSTLPVPTLPFTNGFLKLPTMGQKSVFLRMASLERLQMYYNYVSDTIYSASYILF